MGEVTILVQGAGETPSHPCPTNLFYDGTKPTPPYAVVLQRAHLVSRPPTSHTRARRLGQPAPAPPPPSRPRGAHHRGQVLWQEHLGTGLLLLVVTTRGDPERVLGVIPTHLYGAATVPRPPVPAPEVRDRVHAFLQTQEVTAVTGVHPVRLPPASPDGPWGPRALSATRDWELPATCWPRGSPASRPSPGGWPLTPAYYRTNTTARCPLPSPPPPPRGSTRHCPRHAIQALGASARDTPVTTHAYQGNSDVGL